MREEEIYEILYRINCSKEQYDQKIGILFHDIYMCKDTVLGKVIPIQTQEGEQYGLTIEDVGVLLKKVCNLQIKSERTTMVNEVLSRELSSTLKQYFCKAGRDFSFIPQNALNRLIRESALFIKKGKENEKCYQKESSTFFSKEQNRIAVSDDGFEVKYKVFGQDKTKTMALINAYGMPSKIWEKLIYHYAKEYKVIIWETRGTAPEHVNINLHPIMYSIDLECVLKKEGIVKAALVCWCSGLKILAEFYNRNPDVASMIIILTGYFNPFPENLSYWTDFDKSIGKLSQMIKKDISFSKNPFILELIRKLFQFDIGEKRLEDLLSAEASEDERYDVQNALVKNAAPDVKQLITLPFEHSQTLQSYAEITINLQKHEHLSLLAQIGVPSLIVNAGKDKVADIRCARIGQEFIHNSQMVELPNATHWCIWENYKEVISAVEKFIKELRE